MSDQNLYKPRHTTVVLPEKNNRGMNSKTGKPLPPHKPLHKDADRVFTITFCDMAENHAGMQQIGKLAEHGYSMETLRQTQRNFENLGCETKLVNLNDHFNAQEMARIAGIPTLKPFPEQKRTEYDMSPTKATPISHYQPPEAAVLVVKNGITTLLNLKENGKLHKEPKYTVDDLRKEHGNDHIVENVMDKHALMRGKVVVKHARYNLCFSDHHQEPDIAKGRGTVLAWDEIPFTRLLRVNLGKVIDGGEKLVAEANYYMDLNVCGIGYHGDAERKRVVAARMGAMPIYYQWFHKSEPISKRIEIDLEDGDLYFMSEKAVGFDWKHPSWYTLRHSAGCPKFTVYKKTKKSKKSAPKTSPKRKSPKTSPKRKSPKSASKRKSPKTSPKRKSPKTSPKRKSPKSASKKCKDDEELDETGKKCYKKCQPGFTRNPITKRCKK